MNIIYHYLEEYYLEVAREARPKKIRYYLEVKIFVNISEKYYL